MGPWNCFKNNWRGTKTNCLSFYGPGLDFRKPFACSPCLLLYMNTLWNNIKKHRFIYYWLQLTWISSVYFIKFDTEHSAVVLDWLKLVLTETKTRELFNCQDWAIEWYHKLRMCLWSQIVFQTAVFLSNKLYIYISYTECFQCILVSSENMKIKKSVTTVKFSGPKSCESGDNYFSVCHVNSCWSYDQRFMWI